MHDDVSFEDTTYACSRKEFEYLHYEIFYSLYLDFFSNLYLCGNIHDSSNITILRSYFDLVQNDDKMDSKNEGNVVIPNDRFQDYEENDFTMNIFDETHAHNSSSSNDIENTVILHDLERSEVIFMIIYSLVMTT